MVFSCDLVPERLWTAPDRLRGLPGAAEGGSGVAVRSAPLVRNGRTRGQRGYRPAEGREEPERVALRRERALDESSAVADRMFVSWEQAPDAWTRSVAA